MHGDPSSSLEWRLWQEKDPAQAVVAHVSHQQAAVAVHREATWTIESGLGPISVLVACLVLGACQIYEMRMKYEI